MNELDTKEMKKILIAMPVKYSGEFNKIFFALQSKETLDDKYIAKTNAMLERSGAKAITVIDEDYPECFKKIDNPPFVLFAYAPLNRNTLFVPQGITMVSPGINAASEYFDLNKHLIYSRCERTNDLNLFWQAN